MVKIVQLLCPKRHALLVTAYEEGNGSFQEACDALKTMITAGPFTNYCALCGSKDLHEEEGTTKFTTLQEAMPALMQEQYKNMLTRREMDAAGQTFESQKYGRTN